MEMATKLQEQINAGVRSALRDLGITLPVGTMSEVKQTDHIAFGSDEHRQFLGLVVVSDGDDTSGYTTFTSHYSKKVYRLEDELGVVNLYPGIDPDKAAILVLRQKINELEMPVPKVPANAPSMWTPVDARNMTLLQRGI
jgi:hypothetical protein